jgi:hypothetical protein
VRLMSPESAESWKSIFEIAGVVLLGATFLAGLGFWYFGGKVNKSQQERLRTFDKDLTEAKTKLATQEERAAKAEKELAEVRKKQAQRWIATDKFVAAFGKAKPGKALVQYQTGNEEIAMFASSVAPALVASGWSLAEGPRPIPSAHPEGIVAILFEVFLYTNTKSDPSDPLSPVGGLKKAFTECGYPPTIFGNDSLPEDTVRIVIGPKI